MISTLGDTIKRIRTERGLSQQSFADMIQVDRSSVASWETGRRLPDADMLSRIADCLNVDISYLINLAKSKSDTTNVILVDDEKIILTGGIPVIEKVMPDAIVTGFTKPSEAIEFVKNNTVSIAFLDIEMGKTSGLDLCREMLDIYPRMNIVFLTAYMDYSFDAWSTGACGFLLKPISEESIKEQLGRLRYQFPGGDFSD